MIIFKGYNMEHTITIGSLIAFFGFVTAVVTFINKQKEKTEAHAAKYTNLQNTIKNAEQDIEDLKKDMKEFKTEIKNDLDKLDSQVISRINVFDEKLDAIKNLLIQKLS